MYSSPFLVLLLHYPVCPFKSVIFFALSFLHAFFFFFNFLDFLALVEHFTEITEGGLLGIHEGMLLCACVGGLFVTSEGTVLGACVGGLLDISEGSLLGA